MNRLDPKLHGSLPSSVYTGYTTVYGNTALKAAAKLLWDWKVGVEQDDAGYVK
jgi:hypothetical protein